MASAGKESVNSNDHAGLLPFRRVAILGVGLLGGSIGLAAKPVLRDCQIVGYGHQRETLQKALAAGAITEACQNLEKAVSGAELVVLCTPVGLIAQILEQISPYLSPGAIVTDVGSTKRSIVSAAERCLTGNAHFVGSHPIAGSEKRGVEHARADLFRGALCIVTPTPRTHPKALAAVENFWQQLGMRLARLSPDDHDRLLADVSHLPHALAAALVAMQGDDALSLAGKGFLDSTRIAAGDAGLWRDIFQDNRDHLRASLDRLRDKLDEFSSLLEAANGEKLTAWLQAAGARRAELGKGAPETKKPSA